MFLYAHRRRNALRATLLLHLVLLFVLPLFLPKDAPRVEPPLLTIDLATLTDAAMPSETSAPQQSSTSVSNPAAPANHFTPQTLSAPPSLGDIVADVPAAVVSSGNSTHPSTGNSPAASSGTAASTHGGSIQHPSILSRVAPDYPASARQAGHEGSAMLRVQILENGRCGSISLLRSSGDASLDDAAIVAMRQWRFIPARLADNGAAVSCYTTIPVTFRLQ